MPFGVGDIFRLVAPGGIGAGGRPVPAIQPQQQRGVPISGNASRGPYGYPDWNPPNPLGFMTGNAMMGMQGLGNYIGNAFAGVNALNSMNRQAAYGPEAAMQISQMNNDAENYRTNARLATQLASMGMIGRILGGFSNSLGGLFGGMGGGGGGGMMGFKATDSPQQVSFGGGAPGGASQPGRRPPMQMPWEFSRSPTRMAMWNQRFGG